MNSLLFIPPMRDFVTMFLNFLLLSFYFCLLSYALTTSPTPAPRVCFPLFREQRLHQFFLSAVQDVIIPYLDKPLWQNMQGETPQKLMPAPTLTATQLYHRAVRLSNNLPFLLITMCPAYHPEDLLRLFMEKECKRNRNRINYEAKEHLYKRTQAIVENPYGTLKRQWGFK